MKTVPFTILPPPLLGLLSVHFKGLGRMFGFLKPNLSNELIQSGLTDFEEDEYLSYVVISSLFNLGVFSFLMYFILFRLTAVNSWNLFFGIVLLLNFFTFFMQLNYPIVLMAKKSKDVQQNLLPFLRNLLVRLKSGINLYSALESLSYQEFGIISAELKTAVKEVNTGKSLTKAIEDLGFRTPNPNFRRVAWQISNGLKAGASIVKSVESLADNISKEQSILIKSYGNQLNPLAMMYMMIAVIVPSLGLTFMIVMSSFFGFNLTETIFYGVSFFLVIFQFFFIGILKQKRPSVGV